MKTKALLHAALLIILLGAVNCHAATGMSVQFPQTNSFVENEQLSVIIEVQKERYDTIQVIVGTNKAMEKSVRAGSDRVCLGVTLSRGMNSIEFLGMKQGKVLDRKKLTLFFRSDLFPKFRTPPADFERYYFHFIDNEKSCVGCHDMEPTLSSLRPAKPEDSPCYTCHAKKGTHAFVHNPATQWTCFSCHEVLRGERKYTSPRPNQKVCFPCHNYEMKEWKTKKIMHGPTAVGQCTLCHNPHGSEHPSLLRMQGTDLCINCHEDKGKGSHVIAGFYGKGHPVRGVKDPFNPELEFTCAGCHNPHAGDSQNLLQQDNSNMTVYCSFCHKM